MCFCCGFPIRIRTIRILIHHYPFARVSIIHANRWQPLPFRWPFPPFRWLIPQVPPEAPSLPRWPRFLSWPFAHAAAAADPLSWPFSHAAAAVAAAPLNWPFNIVVIPRLFQRGIIMPTGV